MLALVACGDDDANVVVDAGHDATTPIDGADPCDEDDDCSDGVYCNGIETCEDTVCVRGRAVDCDDGISCTTDVCSDTSSSCRHFGPDIDRDGHPDALCEDNDGNAGDDCDDEDANRFPGNIEVCDAANVDEDCNGTTIGNKDRDNDGAVDLACCNGTTCGTDCDDLKASVSPNASEICDLLDNDCDAEIDEVGAVMLYVDADFDGHGDEDGDPQSQCAGTLGFSADNEDCDDTDPAVHHAQVEICDEKDNDCDTRIDESPRSVLWYRDKDGDRFGGRLEPTVFQCNPPTGYDLRDTDCNDDNAMVSPAAAERCDGQDNNCDLLKTARVDGVNNFEDDDNDGSPDFGCGLGGNDCDDNNSSTGGNLVEICDQLDNDCDDFVDENVADTVWYVDNDGDGYGNERAPAVVFCAPLTGRSAYPGDCNDENPNVNPGAAEVCVNDLASSVDDNCNGMVDEGFCPVCGDGVPEGPEECDDRAPNMTGVCADPDHVCNSDSAVDGCRLDCRAAHCGDGIADSDEACDEGIANSDEPNAACRLNCAAQRCGDGIVDNDTEACDDETIYCRSDCSAALWSDGICAPVTSDLGSAVGTNVVSGDTTGGTTQLMIDGNDTPNNCAFSAGNNHMGPNGPERVYTWTSPAGLLYAFGPTNAGGASRLTVGLFFNDAALPTSCSEPWACLEPAMSGALVAPIPNGEGTAIAIDSAQGQAFSLSIYPLVCCPSNTVPSAAFGCFTATTQAQLSCSLAAVPAACLDNWTQACADTADAACTHTCP